MLESRQLNFFSILCDVIVIYKKALGDNYPFIVMKGYLPSDEAAIMIHHEGTSTRYAPVYVLKLQLCASADGID